MFQRPHYHWRLRTRQVDLGPRTLVMGVVNVTPDSFSDGGRFFDAAHAIDHAQRLVEEGADILDIGGESTRPGKKESVSEQQELDRVLPVIEVLHRTLPQTPISVDTYKAKVAEAASLAGAEIINDVSALRWDPAMAATCAREGCGVILMHMRGRPEDWRTLPPMPGDRLLASVTSDLGQWASSAQTAGIKHDSLILDPGFGFGKNFEENYPLLAHFEELRALGFPLLSGTSRKSFLGRTLARDGIDVEADRRLLGTMATVTASILAGAHIVRVHDVKEAVETRKIADSILDAG